MALGHVEAGSRRRQPGDPVRPYQKKILLAHSTFSATSTSWPTQKARRRTSDPILVRPKCRPVVALAEHLACALRRAGASRRNGSPRFSSSQRTYVVHMFVRLEPLDRLVVRAQGQSRTNSPPAEAPRRPATSVGTRAGCAPPRAARGRAPGSFALPPSACGSRTPPGADSPRRPAEIAAMVMLPASVVRTARRAGSKVRNSGAKERATAPTQGPADQMEDDRARRQGGRR